MSVWAGWSLLWKDAPFSQPVWPHGQQGSRVTGSSNILLPLISHWLHNTRSLECLKQCFFVFCVWTQITQLSFLCELPFVLDTVSQRGEYKYPNYGQAKSYCHSKELFNLSVYVWTHKVTTEVFHFWWLWISAEALSFLHCAACVVLWESWWGGIFHSRESAVVQFLCMAK